MTVRLMVDMKSRVKNSAFCFRRQTLFASIEAKITWTFSVCRLRRRMPATILISGFPRHHFQKCLPSQQVFNCTITIIRSFKISNQISCLTEQFAQNPWLPCYLPVGMLYQHHYTGKPRPKSSGIKM